MAPAKHPPADGGQGVTFSQKWGDDPFTALGYTQVPNALVQYAARLGLKSEECWLICCVLRFKYDAANPCPLQEDLAALFGQSVDTVQRTAQKIVARKLLKLERARSDLGRFTHTVYDFTPLRHALNECYYQDHPHERPQIGRPTTPQICGVDQAADLRCGDEREPGRRSAVWSTPQICGLYIDNKNPAASKNWEDSSSRADAIAPAEKTTDTSAAAAAAAAALVEALIAHDVNRADALRLVAEKPEECRIQLEYLPYIRQFKTSKGAYLRKAIEDGYGAPPAYRDAQQEREATRQRDETSRRIAEERTQQQAERQDAERQIDARWESLPVEQQAEIEEQALSELRKNPLYRARLDRGSAKGRILGAALQAARRRLVAAMFGLAFVESPASDPPDRGERS